MKKAIIGCAVLATLIAYSIGVRHEQPKISTPSSLTADSSSTGSGLGLAGSSGGGNRSSNNSNQGTGPAKSGTYKDGSYTGRTADAYYGDVQVRVAIAGGKIANVTFLRYPNTHSTSVYINRQAMPYLQQEAIKSQSANVDTISGATYTSQAFIQSLSSALSQAS